MKKLNLNAIRTDGGTQSRVEINNEIVADYAEGIRAGIEFPPVVVFHDGADHWLADGFHRFHAHRHAEKASIAADVRPGTVRDAILFSLGANSAHGLHRSNADKRKAVQTMLADSEWQEWSDRKIADACGVSVPFVGAVRRPEVAAKQQESRAASAERKAAGRNPITPPVEAAPAPAPAQHAVKRTLTPPPAEPELTDADELTEAQHTITELAHENEQLRDRLAVEAMDASEEEKTSAAETIADLRARVKALEAEVEALKVSRDKYMVESSEKTKQINYWRKQAKKAGAEA